MISLEGARGAGATGSVGGGTAGSGSAGTGTAGTGTGDGASTMVSGPHTVALRAGAWPSPSALPNTTMTSRCSSIDSTRNCASVSRRTGFSGRPPSTAAVTARPPFPRNARRRPRGRSWTKTGQGTERAWDEAVATASTVSTTLRPAPGDARFGIAAFRKVIGISRRRCVPSWSRASGA